MKYKKLIGIMTIILLLITIVYASYSKFGDVDITGDLNVTTGTIYGDGSGITGSPTLTTLTLINDLTVSNGGTGASTFTDGGVLLGSGTGAISALSVLSNGQIIIGDGTTDPTTLSAFTTSSGTLKHEYGGLEANVAGYTNGLYGQISGATADIDTLSELNSVISDATLLKSGGTLTTSKWCIYDGSGIDCNVEPVSDTTYSAGNGISLATTTFSVAGNTCLDQDTDGLGVTANCIGNTQLEFDTGQALTTTSDPTFDALTTTTLNTGQGANELYDMDQNVLTTSNVNFNNATIADCILFASGGMICSGN